jgi:parallel beta-helix repeat protein
VAAPIAEAKRIDVKPGRGTLQKAVDRAERGDKLELRSGGAYRGGVVIDKRLTVRGPRDGAIPRIDGRCREAFTILVLAGPVKLTRFRATGSSNEVAGQYGGAEVNFIDGGRGKAVGLELEDGCGSHYGINVFDTGNVIAASNQISGYDDAAVYVGGIRQPGTVIDVHENVAMQNARGVLFEDSLPEASLLAVDNVVSGNDVGTMSAGVYVRNTDGSLVEGNVADSNGFAGVWLDQSSDGNVVRGNSATGNGSSDLLNEGQGNCGGSNTFGSEAGNPLAVC